MATPAYCFTTLKIDLDEKPEEITICCNGRITAESAHMFEREVRGHAIPDSRGPGAPGIGRIVLDLTNVTHIDEAGLQALVAVWTAGQKKSCSMEIINHRGTGSQPSFMASLDQIFRKVQALFV